MLHTEFIDSTNQLSFNLFLTFSCPLQKKTYEIIYNYRKRVDTVRACAETLKTVEVM